MSLLYSIAQAVEGCNLKYFNFVVIKSDSIFRMHRLQDEGEKMPHCYRIMTGHMI